MAEEELAPAELFARTRAAILSNIEQLPRFTCVRTVHRSKWTPPPGVEIVGCDKSRDVRRVRAWADRYRLEVTIADGSEIFSWAGAERFQSGNVEEIVGEGGLTGTGDFGRFLKSVFGGGAPEPEFSGAGSTSAKYRYRVPVERSRYEMKIGRTASDVAPLAYEGTIEIDSRTAVLRRITVEVASPPTGSNTCEIETAIEYQFLLPRVTSVKLVDVEGALFDNRIEYSSCRQFQSDSILLPGDETLQAAPQPDALQPAPPIPAGRALQISLLSRISLEDAFAGDTVEGRILSAIRGRGGTVVVPAGSLARGRIVRFRQEFHPLKYLALGLEFHSVIVDGRAIPVTLLPLPRSRADELLAGPAEKRDGIGMFVFRGERPRVESGFISNWKTVSSRERR